ncbi:polysaccharide biosynthesis protein [Propioniciclava sinopodophylli]|uniref:Polysaccharide biosynthesis protein n=1 Tax=Propioniciclava sinopodophylli TaxID=1837344 RepID=A0A4Q9KAQ4_9ACTN|nr:nucleoside-diphosphate sugar epimerase/dehydratase [Propioniciclava sinopodophylli]TBT82573.1 polysaccharide biosynthesis protein [Propioniciclava sinopodophylli]
MFFRIAVRRSGVVLWDVAMWALALVALVLLRFDLSLSAERWAQTVQYFLLATLCQVLIGFAVHLYLGRSRLGSFGEVSLLGLVVLVSAVISGGVGFLVSPEFSRSVAVTTPALALLGMVGGRVLFRAFYSDDLRRAKGAATRALIYGAGDAGSQVAKLVDTAVEPPYTIAGYLDDDPTKKFLRIRGYRILGRGEDLEGVASQTEAETLILAVSEASPQFLADLDARAKALGLKLVVVPPVREMIDGRVELDKLRQFNVADLLGRRPIKTDLSEIAGYLSGKIVLVTGAGGSIGSELARQLKKLGPAKLLLLDRDESALHAVQLSIYGQGLLDTDDMVLCDIRDSEALMKIFRRHRPEVVFHAAALKHLPMLEQYPDEGWKTNVLGTLNVLDAAHQVGAERFVNISTDKAADATAVLGQTKRLAERLTAHYAELTGRPYLSVRFGNVLGSRGSVLYAFRAQIERGGPLTVTHPDVTRFFMTIPEACELVLQAGAIGQPGDALVLDMGEPVKIVDVAKRLLEESGRTDIEITYTGLRHGEKLHEVLFSQGEDHIETQHPLISCVPVPPITPRDVIAADSWDELVADYDPRRAL